MKKTLAILVYLASALMCTAQHGQWHDLSNGRYQFDSGDITSLYCQPGGTVFVGTDFKSIITQESTYGKLFQCDSANFYEPSYFPFYKKEMAIQHIVGDGEGNVYIAGYYKKRIRTTRTFVLYDIPFIYKWNGDVLRQVYIGNSKQVYDVYVEALCVDAKGNLYATGSAFKKDKHRYIALWNGKDWSEVGADKSPLRAEKEGTLVLCADAEGNIYAAGNFSGHAKGNVCKWDGNEWLTLGEKTILLNANKDIRSMVVDSNGNLYVAGAFVNTDKKQFVAKWNGESWSEVGGGTSSLNANQDICVLFIDPQGMLYAAGRFVNSSGNKYVAKWDGTQWLELGGENSLQANSDILTLSMDNQGRLYASGRFKNINGKHYVAVYIP